MRIRITILFFIMLSLIVVNCDSKIMEAQNLFKDEFVIVENFIKVRKEPNLHYKGNFTLPVGTTVKIDNRKKKKKIANNNKDYFIYVTSMLIDTGSDDVIEGWILFSKIKNREFLTNINNLTRVNSIKAYDIKFCEYNNPYTIRYEIEKNGNFKVKYILRKNENSEGMEKLLISKGKVYRYKDLYYAIIQPKSKIERIDAFFINKNNNLCLTEPNCDGNLVCSGEDYY